MNVTDVSWCPFTSLVVSLTFLSITQLFIYWLIFFFSLKMLLCSITDKLQCIFSKGITLSGGTLIGVMFVFDNHSGQDTCRTCPMGSWTLVRGGRSPPYWAVVRMAASGAPRRRRSPASVEAFQRLTGRLGCLGGCRWGQLRVSSA